eukprot:1195814-Prorocentrum_minimum.AAC.6
MTCLTGARRLIVSTYGPEVEVLLSAHLLLARQTCQPQTLVDNERTNLPTADASRQRADSRRNANQGTRAFDAYGYVS